MTAPHGQVSALAAGGGLALLFRIVGGAARALAAGAGATASWLEFRAEPSPGAEGGHLRELARGAANLRLAGRLALGRLVHARAGLTGGVALRGVEATDAGLVVARARGVVLGATLGLEAP